MRRIIAIQTDKSGKDIPGTEREFNLDHWLRMNTMRVVRWRKIREIMPVKPKPVVVEPIEESMEETAVSEEEQPRKKRKRKQIKDKEL